jgi:hypothetical protein
MASFAESGRDAMVALGKGAAAGFEFMVFPSPGMAEPDPVL